VDANDNRTEFTWDPSGLPASKSVMGKQVGGAWEGDLRALRGDGRPAARPR